VPGDRDAAVRRWHVEIALGAQRFSLSSHDDREAAERDARLFGALFTDRRRRSRAAGPDGYTTTELQWQDMTFGQDSDGNHWTTSMDGHHNHDGHAA
jgi:hypothetical protein